MQKIPKGIEAPFLHEDNHDIFDGVWNDCIPKPFLFIYLLFHFRHPAALVSIMLSDMSCERSYSNMRDTF